MSVLKMVARLENVSYAAAAQNRMLAELSAASASEDLEAALLQNRKIRLEFDRAMGEIDANVAEFAYKYTNSADLTFAKAWKHWNFVETGRGEEIFTEDQEIHLRIMAEGSTIKWICDDPCFIDPGRLFDKERLGEMWFFAAIRLFDLFDCGKHYQNHQLNRLRDAGFIDDRDLYAYAGKILGRRTDPFFFIKPQDITNVQNNIQIARINHSRYVEKLEEYCKFGSHIRVRRPHFLDTLIERFQTVAKSTAAIAAAFRGQVEGGAASLDQLWGEYLEMCKETEKTVAG